MRRDDRSGWSATLADPVSVASAAVYGVSPRGWSDGYAPDSAAGQVTAYTGPGRKHAFHQIPRIKPLKTSCNARYSYYVWAAFSSLTKPETQPHPRCHPHCHPRRRPTPSSWVFPRRCHTSRMTACGPFSFTSSLSCPDGGHCYGRIL